MTMTINGTIDWFNTNDIKFTNINDKRATTSLDKRLSKLQNAVDCQLNDWYRCSKLTTALNIMRTSHSN